MRPNKKDERYNAATDICRRLTNAGYQALFAGGCVRDMFLDRAPKDYDVATSASPSAIAECFPKCISVGAAFGVQIVVLPEGMFEVATFRKDGPYRDGRHPDYVEFTDAAEDAFRRDFTINAMFFDPATEAIIDYVDGIKDLNDKVIRAVGDPCKRFEEDRLRILRAIRFAARLGYEIEPATWNAIRAIPEKACEPSMERIRDEISKMLIEGGARKAIELLDASGVLPHTLPEIAALKGVEQPPEFHPEGDVFEHTLRMLDMARNPSVTLAMGLLLHDVGKPITQTFEDRIRFNNHDKVGACEAKSICRRLRFSSDETKRIAWLVENHMRVDAIPEMRENKRKRFVREDGFDELLELCKLDCLASHNKLDTILWIENYIATLPADALKPPPLLRGDDLIAMGYRPGPRFSEILRAVEDELLEGRLTTPEQARQFVASIWPLDEPTP